MSEFFHWIAYYYAKETGNNSEKNYWIRSLPFIKPFASGHTVGAIDCLVFNWKSAKIYIRKTPGRIQFKEMEEKTGKQFDVAWSPESVKC